MKKFLTKKLIAVYLCIAISITTLALSFAWFTGTIDRTGVSITTGEINVIADGYYYENSTLTKATHGIGDQFTLVSSSLLQYGEKKDIYFIVSLGANSIDADFLLTLQLENALGDVINTLDGSRSDPTYLGGFWFQLSDITTDTLAQSTSITDIEDKLVAYVQYQQNNNIQNIGAETSMNRLSQNQMRGSLDEEHNVCYFRLTYGYSYLSETYTSRTFRIRATVNTAQQGALTDEEQRNMNVWYVSTYQELLNVYSQYLPGDVIKITQSFTVPGDLTFMRPVNLKIANATLTIEGNLIYEFPYTDEYYIDTAAAGKLLVRSYGSIGGNLEIKTPNAKVEFIGKGDQTSVGDIFVQNEVIINSSYQYGAILTGANFFETTVSGTVPVGNFVKKIIYFGDDTLITINENTHVGQIIPVLVSSIEDTPRIVKIVNHGTVDKILLTSMALDATINTNSCIPQIYVDNYGTYGTSSDNRIALPTWSTPFSYDDTTETSTGNTYIIQEEHSNDLSVSITPSIANQQNDTYYRDSDIIRITVNQFVIDEYGNGKALTINYTDYINGQQTLLVDGQSNTIKDILDDFYLNYKHIPSISYNLNDELAKVEYLTIKSYQNKSLTTSDFSYIRMCSNLLDLDLSLAYCTTINFRDLQGLSNLTEISLPNNCQRICKDFLMGNSLIDEIYIPKSVTTFDYSWLDGTSIKYIHLLNSSSVCNLNMSLSNKVIFVHEDLLDSYLATTTTKGVYYAEATRNYNKSCFYRVLDNGLYELAYQISSLDVDSNNNYIVDSFEFEPGRNISFASVGDYALYHKAFISTDMISFGNSVTYLGAGNFSMSINAHTINLNNITEIGNSCFYNAHLTTLISNKLKIVNSYGFGSASITNFNLSSVEIAYSYAFSGMTLSGEVTFSGLKTVYSNVFDSCYNIEILNLPSLEEAYPFALVNMAKVYRIYAPNLKYCYCDINTDYIINKCPKLVELYIGPMLYNFKGYIISNTNSVKMVFVCGDTPYSNATSYYTDFTNAPYLRYYINENCYNSYSTKYFLTSKYPYSIFVTVDFDPANIYKAGTYYGETNEYTTNLGDSYYGIDNNSNAAYVSYSYGKEINNTTTINNTFEIPSTVSINGNNYPVTRVLDYAFNASKIILDNFVIANSVKSLGKNCFKGDSNNVIIKNFTANGVENAYANACKNCSFTDSFSMTSLKNAYNASFFQVQFPAYVSFPSLLVAESYSFYILRNVVDFSASSLHTAGEYTFYAIPCERLYLPSLTTYTGNFAIYDTSKIFELYIGPILDYSAATKLMIGNLRKLNYLYICSDAVSSSDVISTNSVEMFNNFDSLKKIYVNESAYDALILGILNKKSDYIDKVPFNPLDSFSYGSYHGDNNEYTLDFGLYRCHKTSTTTAEIMHYQGSTISNSDTVTTFTVPSIVNDGTNNYNVTKIGDWAFGRISISIDNFIVPDGITSIGDNAFDSSKIGKSVKCFTANGVVNAGKYAFQSFVISEDFNFNNLYSVDNYCFSKSTIYSTLSTSKFINLETAGDFAFNTAYISSTNNVFDDLKTIGENTFYNASILSSTGTTEFPNLETAGYRAFYSAKTSRVFRLPKLLTISTACFALVNCVELYADISTDVGLESFYSCANLEFLYIPKAVNYLVGITSGTQSAIISCGKLHTLYMGAPCSYPSYTLIRSCPIDNVFVCGDDYTQDSLIFCNGQQTFMYLCQNKSLFINSNTYDIFKNSAMKTVGNIVTVDCDPIDLKTTGDYYGDPSKGYTVNWGEYIYQFTSETDREIKVIKCNLPSISTNFTVLGSVTINSNVYSVTAIHDYAFVNTAISCNTFTIPSSIETIGKYAFSASKNVLECNNLIASGVTYIDDYGFEKFNILSDFDFGELASIGKYAFTSSLINSSTSEFESLTYANNYAFYKAIINYSIDVFPELIEVGDYAFCETTLNPSSGDSEFSALEIAGKYAFYKTVTTPIFRLPNLIIVNKFCFANLPNTKELYLDHATSFLSSSVYYNASLELLYAPESTSFIAGGYYEIVMQNNTKLHDVYLGAILNTDNYRIIYNSPAINIFICGTSYLESDIISNVSSTFLSATQTKTIFVNSNVYSIFSSSRSRWLADNTSICVPYSGDPINIKKYGNYYGDSTRNYTVNMGEYLYHVTSETNKQVEIVKYNPPSITTDFTICSSMIIEGNTYTVTGIYDYAFENAQINVENFTIPASITRIGKYSFRATKQSHECDNFIASGVTYIDRYAFDSFIIHEDFNFSSLLTIGEYSFNNAQIYSNTSSFSSLTTVENYAFCGCKLNYSVQLFPVLTTAQDYSFTSTTFNPSSGDTIFPALETTGKYTFYQAITTSKFRLPSLLVVSLHCFDNLKTTTELYLDSALEINSCGVSNCSILELLYAPSLYRYYAGGYYECNIYNNKKLHEIYIGAFWFTDNYRLIFSCPATYIYICGTNPNAYTINNASNDCLSGVQTQRIFINENLYSIFTTYPKCLSWQASLIAKCSGDPKDIKPYGTYYGASSNNYTVNLGEYLYYVSDSVNKKVTLVDYRLDSLNTDLISNLLINGESYAVEAIDNSAFEKTIINTSRLVIPNTVTYIGTNAFKNSGNTFTSVSYGGDGVIKENAFESNSNLRTVYLLGNISNIEANAFKNLSNVSLTLYKRDSVLNVTNIFGTGTNNKLYVHGVVYNDYCLAAPWNGISQANIFTYSGVYEENSIKYFYDNIGGNEINIIYISGNLASGTLVIPNTITESSVTYNVVALDSHALVTVSNLSVINIGSNLRSFVFEPDNVPSTLERYVVDSSNTSFDSDSNGALYSEGYKVLISYPKAATGTSYTVNSLTQIISDSAFKGNSNLTDITINSVVYVMNYAFADMSDGITLTFSQVYPSYFVGIDIFNNVSTYTIDVPDSYIANYISNVYGDVSIVSHIE